MKDLHFVFFHHFFFYKKQRAPQISPSGKAMDFEKERIAVIRICKLSVGRLARKFRKLLMLLKGN